MLDDLYEFEKCYFINYFKVTPSFNGIKSFLDMKTVVFNHSTYLIKQTIEIMGKKGME